MTSLIIGGGLVGLSTACAIAKSGRSVHLIDTYSRPKGASWGNAGHIATEQVSPLASVATIRSFPHRLYWRGGALSLPLKSIGTWLPFALRFCNASRPSRFEQGKTVLKTMLADAFPAWERLAEQAGLSHLVRRSGHYIVWETPETASKGRAAWMSADSGTTRFRDISRDEREMLFQLVKSPLAGAIFCEGSGQIANLGAMADGLRIYLMQMGGEIEQGHVARLVHKKGRVSALMDNGQTIEADEIIITAGARSGDLLRPIGHKVPIIDERGYHIQSQADEEVWPEETPPVVFEDRSMIVTRFAKTLRAASFVEFSRADAAPDSSKWRRLHKHADALGLPIGSDAQEWHGSRPTLPDYLPAIGRSDRADNLYYAFGHQHLGMTLSAITGEAMLSLLNGAPPFPPLSLDRFE